MDDAQTVILVLDRGRVMAARMRPHPERAFWFRLEPARVIRRWGTQRGLEQLAASGPLPDTVLDDPAVKDVPWRAVLEILHVEEAAWGGHLNLSSGRPSPTRQGR